MQDSRSTRTARATGLTILIGLAFAVPMTPAAQATGCSFAPTESGGGSCTFVCELDYLHVTITSADSNAEVAIAAECRADSNPTDPEDGVPPWEASCVNDRTCNGDGSTVHAATGRCVADIDEWNNDVWEGGCVNDSSPDAEFANELVLCAVNGVLTGDFQECVECVVNGVITGSFDCAQIVQLGAVPACALTEGAMRLCLHGLLASLEGGGAVVLAGQDGVVEAAVCAAGACWATLPTVLPRLGGVTVTV